MKSICEVDSNKNNLVLLLKDWIQCRTTVGSFLLNSLHVKLEKDHKKIGKK